MARSVSSRTSANAATQQRTAQVLQETEARLKAVLDTAVDAIVTINERGLIQSVNPATERMFDYTAAELIGRNVSMLMPAPYHDEHDEYLARYLKTGNRRIIGIGREVQARRRDGHVFPVDLAVSEVERGKLFTGIIRDISERKRAEARARESDRLVSIGTLAAGLGHDMNNVLLPVRAHLNALKAELDTTVGSHHIERVQKGVDYLQQLADGLHYLAMDPDTEGNEGGATNLAQWWSQTGALLSKAVPKHVSVEAELPEDLPAVAAPTHALTQAMLNLIVNAGEAIPLTSDGPAGRVRVWARAAKNDPFVRLAVTDNGTGMTDEVKRRAMELFFTTKPRGLGTGLGLALVRKVVEQAGGRVEIESALGKATTVSCLLPAVEAGSAAGTPPRLVITLADQRATAIVSSLASAAGADVRMQDAPDLADVWIVEPTSRHLAKLNDKRSAPLVTRLVLFGEPRGRDRKAWLAHHPIVVQRTDDVLAIRAALSEAMASLEQE